jgi:DNA-binding winged helix-turn-helix (wHTH) protein/TolB-like protein
MDSDRQGRPRPLRQSFGAFIIDADRVEVARDGTPVPLRAKTFALLQLLVDRAGSVVSKQELIDAVWPGVVVTDDSLTQAVSELRAALGDHDRSLIRTVLRHGYRLEAAVTAVAPSRPIVPLEISAAPAAIASLSAGLTTTPTPPSPRRVITGMRLAAMLGGVAAVAAIVFVLRPAESPQSRNIGTALAESRSLAVMPFTDLSEPPAPHLAQAIDMDLTSDLGRLPDTRVVARASTAMLGTSASVDIKRVGRELDVRHVVTGSVRRDGERVYVTVQLARSDTGALLFSERFDYPSAAEWVARHDVSVRIANWLDVKVKDAALRRAITVAPNKGAVDHWMRGAYRLSRARSGGELIQARQEFEAAVAAQPDSTHALAGLAMTYVEEAVQRVTDDRAGALATAERLARHSLGVDPSHQESMAALSRALMFNGKLDEAMPIVRRRLAINPTDPYAVGHLAVVLYFRGRWEEAIAQAEISLRLNPLDSEHAWHISRLIATSLIVLRRYDEAIARVNLQVGSAGGRGAGLLAVAEALRGNLDAARRHAAEALERNPNLTISRFAESRGSTEPAFVAGMEHYQSGLRLAGFPEGSKSK